jgi:hypothetical protein
MNHTNTTDSQKVRWVTETESIQELTVLSTELSLNVKLL